MPLTIGQTLQNRYRIVRPIGQGGFGAVYRAWDTSLNHPIALKENLDTSAEAQRQFQREATMMAGLRHPGLPRVTDHFFIPGRGQYLVMDFVEGNNLAELLAARQGAPFSEVEILPWLQQVCAALEYLHSRHPPIIHRDIKPQNIIITPEGQAILVDFGISKIYDEKLATTQGARAVTPGYSPPEQYGAGKTDARTDIYALGAMLYSLLTGAEPPSSVDIISGADNLTPPRHLNPQLNPTVEQAILQAMSVNMSQRFNRVSELLTTITSSNTSYPTSPPSHAPILPILSGKSIPNEIAAISPENAMQVTQLNRLDKGRIGEIAYSPYGTMLAVASNIGISLHDVINLVENRLIRSVAGIGSLAFSPDGATLACGSWDGIVWLWRVSDGALLQTMEGHVGWVNSVAFSPDGTTLASGSSDSSVRLWSVGDGGLLRKLEGYANSVRSVAFSPDGVTLASGSSDGSMHLWCIRDGALLQNPEGHKSWVTSMAFSPDGTMLVSGSWDGTVRLWHVSDGALRQTLEGHMDSVNSVTFSPSGAILVSGSSDGSVRLWRVSNGAWLHTLEGHTNSVSSVVFSPDGAALASGSADGTVRLWGVR